MFDMIDEAREIAHIHKFTRNQIKGLLDDTIPSWNSREMKEGDLVVKKGVVPTKIGKMLPKREGQYMVH